MLLFYATMLLYPSTSWKLDAQIQLANLVEHFPTLKATMLHPRVVNAAVQGDKRSALSLIICRIDVIGAISFALQNFEAYFVQAFLILEELLLCLVIACDDQVRVDRCQSFALVKTGSDDTITDRLYCLSEIWTQGEKQFIAGDVVRAGNANGSLADKWIDLIVQPFKPDVQLELILQRANAAICFVERSLLLER